MGFLSEDKVSFHQCQISLRMWTCYTSLCMYTSVFCPNSKVLLVFYGVKVSLWSEQGRTVNTPSEHPNHALKLLLCSPLKWEEKRAKLLQLSQVKYEVSFARLPHFAVILKGKIGGGKAPGEKSIINHSLYQQEAGSASLAHLATLNFIQPAYPPAAGITDHLKGNIFAISEERKKCDLCCSMGIIFPELHRMSLSEYCYFWQQPSCLAHINNFNALFVVWAIRNGESLQRKKKETCQNQLNNFEFMTFIKIHECFQNSQSLYMPIKLSYESLLF